MFCFPSAAKNGSKRLKNGQNRFPKASCNSSLSFPGPGPPKTWKHQQSEGFLGDGRAPEQLKLGKLQATPPYGEASPDCGGLSDIRCSRLRSGSAHWHLAPVVQVREYPLTSGMRGWGPAVPTEIWGSRLTSGSAHWDLELKTGHTIFADSEGCLVLWPIPMSIDKNHWILLLVLWAHLLVKSNLLSFSVG